MGGDNLYVRWVNGMPWAASALVQSACFGAAFLPLWLAMYGFPDGALMSAAAAIVAAPVSLVRSRPRSPRSDGTGGSTREPRAGVK